MIHVFVYGTLRRGERNADLLQNATCLAEQAWTDGSLYDTSFGYPAMDQSLSSRTYGELYLIDEEQLRRLDLLEGYSEAGQSNLFERIIQTVYTDNGQYQAYLYVASDPHLLRKKITTGDWKEYQLLMNPNDSVLYFAYGSCMDQQRFIQEGAAHYFENIIGVGELSNYTVRFTHRSSYDGMGRADVVEEGGSVEGIVYQIPVKALKNYLYQREGAPSVYRPTFVSVKLPERTVNALTFVVTNKLPETAPPYWYEQEIIRGGTDRLSKTYIATIQRHINEIRK